ETSTTIFLNIFVNIIFIIDLILNSYYSLNSPPDSEEKNYFKTWFTIDFVAALPIEILAASFHVFFNYQYISLIKVLRILRVAKIFQTWNKIGAIKPTRLSYQRILVFGLFTTIICHWVALGWILVGGVKMQGSITSAYINSLYWTITTFTTIGYGDITPQNEMQRVFTMFIMVTGVGLYGYIIGNITSLLSSMDHAKLSFNERMEKISTFLTYKKIPNGLQKKVYSYYSYLWETHKGYDESLIMNELPFSLRMRIALFMNKHIIEKIPLFQNASEEIISEIVMQLKPAIYTPGDYIFKEGDDANHMYFISQGEVEVLNEKTAIVLAKMGEGGYFGEMALLFSSKRSATVRATDFCDLYLLDRTHFFSVIGKYPEFEKEIRQIAHNRMKENMQKVDIKPAAAKKKVSKKKSSIKKRAKP
ncbi:MAG: ion transporter, partial [Leptospiraceae bacterium]|nr:ion transporter [Leptospiraceae bacterium]